jgi:hypothetical protein
MKVLSAIAIALFQQGPAVQPHPGGSPPVNPYCNIQAEDVTIPIVECPGPNYVVLLDCANMCIDDYVMAVLDASSTACTEFDAAIMTWRDWMNVIAVQLATCSQIADTHEEVLECIDTYNTNFNTIQQALGGNIATVDLDYMTAIHEAHEAFTMCISNNNCCLKVFEEPK